MTDINDYVHNLSDLPYPPLEKKPNFIDMLF